MATIETYTEEFNAFDLRVSGTTPVWLREMRKTAIGRFAALGFPGPKDDKWRFTRIRPLFGHEFRMADGYERDSLSSREIDRLCMEDTRCRRLAFVNGHFADDLSDLGDLPAGVRIGSLKQVIETDPEPVQRFLSRYAGTEESPFVALNTAHIHDGTFVRIPKGVRVETPIHVLYVSRSDGNPIVSHPRTLVIAEEDTRAMIVESYVGFESDTYFTNAVTEIVAGARSEIDHCKLQREGDSAYHIATVRARVEEPGKVLVNIGADTILQRTDGEAVTFLQDRITEMEAMEKKVAGTIDQLRGQINEIAQRIDAAYGQSQQPPSGS